MIIFVHRIEKATSLKIIILSLPKENYRLKQNTAVVIAAKVGCMTAKKITDDKLEKLLTSDIIEKKQLQQK